MMRRTLVCLVWFLVFCLLPLTGCKRNTSSTAPLVVGMDLSCPPFEMINKEGKPEGVSVDFANALGAYLKREVVIENIPFVGLIPSLKTRKIDLIISSISATPERKRAIAFSDPYLSTGLALLLHKGVVAKTAKDLDLPRKTIVVHKGTTGEIFAKNNFIQASVVSVDNEGLAVTEVVQGKADAFIYDQMTVWKNWHQNPDTTEAILTPVQIEKWSVGLRQSDDALRMEVNAFIKSFRETGGFEKLGDKFLKEQRTSFEEQKIPFVF
ncbi:MAG: transporter substrate-binding domain-containing protein [Chthoniobacterales bacterium]